MKKIVTIFFFTLIGFYSNAQQTDISPFTVSIEDFNNDDISNNDIVTHEGNSYMIIKTKYARGFKIKHEDKWLKHGVYYLLSSSTGKVTEKRNYSYGLKEGDNELYRSDGTLVAKYFYKNNLKEGTGYKYHVDGKSVQYKISFINDKKDGEEIEFRVSGIKSFVTNYKKGKRHGYQMHYAEDGSLYSKTKYDMGKFIEKTYY